MRKRQSEGGLSINAVAGSYVVILGLDIDKSLRKGLRGFAVKRQDRTESESYWMSGTKVFRSIVPHPAKGVKYSSAEHPFQTFQWYDYSAKPEHSYTYTVSAMYGDPGALEARATVAITVKTEPVEGATHIIHFNRGAAASQEYARRFQNKRPSEVGQGAYDWLSRGLVEGILGFIERAKGKGWGLKGAFYEFQWPLVLKALGAAKKRGADVKVVFDDIDGNGPHTQNEEAIAACRIKSITKPRTLGKLMHNKFLVLTKAGKPQTVLFGSTNLTENGLYGHANCVHIVEDATRAGKYLTYYEKLATDPATSRDSDYKQWTIDETPAPATEFDDGMASVFSPRANLDALEWYADLAASAKDGLFMTFAFGMAKQFHTVYAKDDAVLRFGLMEKEWNGANKDKQIAAVREVQRRPNVTIAIGNRIPLNGFDQWLGEIDRITDPVNVHWIHLKFMLVDPLSDDPLVVTGSANFSEASTRTNDENMTVIKGNTRVADIYFGEYMRLYSHYAFREAVAIFLKNNPGASVDDMPQGRLIEDGDWTEPYFDPADRSARMARRLYFAGT
jgi:hypothetical protein